MAIRSSCYGLPSVAAPGFGTRKATLRFSTAVRSSHEHLSNSARSIKTVFEDQVRGVVCYKDDKGEVICEGYDEGPRLGMRLQEKACFPRRRWFCICKMRIKPVLYTLQQANGDPGH